MFTQLKSINHIVKETLGKQPFLNESSKKRSENFRIRRGILNIRKEEEIDYDDEEHNIWDDS